MSDSFFQKTDTPPVPQANLGGSPAPSPHVAKKRGSSFSFFLAGLLFVGVVGVIAWITQFMPTWRAEKKITSGPDPSAVAVIKFAFVKAVWDKDDEEYAREMERGSEGHFDFPFENLLDRPAEIGVEEVSCGCSSLEVCLLPESQWDSYRQEVLKDPLKAKDGAWNWVKLNLNEPKGIEVPPKGKGLVRVNWHERREVGFLLKLYPKVWLQPLGQPDGRGFETLQVNSRVAPPLRYAPPRVNVGIMSTRDTRVAEFTLWSNTRPSLELKWLDSGAPTFHYEARELNPDECKQLEKKLLTDGENTRVLKAFQLKVTVHEQASGKQLAQGPFLHTVRFPFEGDKVAGPQILGNVRGGIIVGSEKSGGNLNLETFRTKSGTNRKVALWTEDDTVIMEIDSLTPATLNVKLTKGEKTGNRVKWELDVTVPPGTQFGEFPEDSAIILRVLTDPPRFIRIPVLGNGLS